MQMQVETSPKFPGDCGHNCWIVVGHYEGDVLVPFSKATQGKPDLLIRCTFCQKETRFNQKLNCLNCFVARVYNPEALSVVAIICPKCAGEFDYNRPDVPFPHWEISR